MAEEVALEGVDAEGFHRARIHFVLDALGDMLVPIWWLRSTSLAITAC